jgi:hypothetical protein
VSKGFHGIVSRLQTRQVNLDQPVTRQESSQEGLQHRDVAGLGEFERLA